jgi:hypothetical protein
MPLLDGSRRAPTASTLSLPGIVKLCTLWERRWFQVVEPVGRDGSHVRACRDVVPGEVMVDDLTCVRIHDARLMERHGQAHGHPADELGPGDARVDDPSDGEDPQQPRDPDFTGINVHPDLGELGSDDVSRMAGHANYRITIPASHASGRGRRRFRAGR